MEKNKNVVKKNSRPLKLARWLKFFLDESGTTFLNATASAKAAGYQAKSDESFRSIGHQNFIKLHADIDQWLDEYGFTEAKLKTKLFKLLESKKFVFVKIKGAVNEGILPQGCRLVAVSGELTSDARGNVFGSGDSLIAIETDALEIQRRTLDMALKIKGLYAPEKHEHTGKGGTPMSVLHGEMSHEEAHRLYLENLKRPIE